MSTATYVEYFVEYGRFLGESDVKRCDHRDPKLIIKDGIPKGCYGFRFFDRQEVESEGEKLTGNRKNESPRYLYGKKLSKEEVELNEGKGSILFTNMNMNNWPYVVETCFGRCLTWANDDIILGEKPNA